jgi:hypothetical protein
MRDPLVAWLEEDPMNVKMFLEYGQAMPWWSKAVYKIRVMVGV